MRIVLLLLVAIAFLSQPAFAVNDWGYPGCSSSQTVGANDETPICFDFNSSLSPASTSFAVRAPSALACLRPDVATVGVKTATAVIYFCPTGNPASTTACGIQTALISGFTLDGTNGTTATQAACVALGPGSYFVAITALPAGAEVGLLTVQGGK